MPASSNATKGRLARARAQKGGGGGGRNTSASSNNAGGAEDVKRIEVSSSGTFGIIFLLLTIGASLATSYILTNNPGCMSLSNDGGSSTATSSSSTTAASNLRTPPATGTAAASVPVPPPAPAPPSKEGFPPACTTEQKSAVLKQLTADKCFDQPYTQQCSFVTATVRGTCPQDNSWMRKFYSQFTAQDNTFNAIFAHGICNRDERMMDVLGMGSHDLNKYDKQKWMGGSFGSDCRKPITPSSTVQSAKALCINGDSSKLEAVNKATSSIGLAPDDIKGINAKMGAVESFGLKTLDKVVEEAGWKDKPIHYLKMGGDDAEVLRGASKTLDQVRYLEFEYHYQGTWANGSLSDIVKRQLFDKGFVCYWNGGQNGLWRITDCWQAHYAQKWWSQLACVSTVHEEGKQLLEHMEQYFKETLQKTQSF